MRNILFFLLFLGFISPSAIQAQSILKDSQTAKTNLHSIENQTLPTSFRLLELDNKAVKKTLSAKLQAKRCIDIPLPNGTDEAYILEPAPILPADLAAKYPSIQTYKGHSQDNPKQTLRIAWSARSFHAMGFSDEGTFFIEKVLSGSKVRYMSYLAKDEVREPFTCSADATALKSASSALENKMSSIAIGTELRTYRLATSFTPDLTDNYATTAEAMDALVELVNGLNVIFERDLCLTFQIAANNDLLFFTAANAPTGIGSIGANTGIINDVIGAETYDIGMVCTPGGGGVSYLGITCGGGKAGTQTPKNVLYAAHELGHNMAAGHTMNACPGGGFNNYEPGSGNTLMGYAWLCGSGYNMPGGDIYQFHTNSIQQMYNHLYLGGGNCAAITPTGNTPPTATVGTGGFYIPIQTPFILTGSGTDVEDPAAMTYLWEQYDYGNGSPPSAPTGNGPVFRIYPIDTVPYRIFPELTKVINGTSDIGEVLPFYSREFNFRFTVRDNFPGGGGSHYESIQFFADENAGPFEVNHPNDNTSTWSVGQSRLVTWEVSNTDVAPVNALNVNILLSTDGGYTYPFTLASNVPNNGVATIVVPNTIGVENRIKVEAADNIFFDISNENFEIVGADTHDFTTSFDTNINRVCNETSVDYQIDLYALGTFTNNVELSLSGLPPNATLSLPSSVNPISSSTLTISDLNLVAKGNYIMTLSLNEAGGGVSKTQTLYLVVKGTAEGLPSQAMSFDGSNYISIPQVGGDYQFGKDSDFSIDFWLNTSSTAGDDAILANKNWGNGRNAGWVFALQSGRVVFNIGDGSSRTDIGSGITINDGEWHHVAATVSRYQSGKVQLYIDGVLRTEKLLTVRDVSNNLPIGLGADANGSYKYEGLLEEVRIWRKALTETEIRERIHRTLNTCEADLISCYQFNESSGDVLDPISFYNGTVNGATRIASTAPIGPGMANSQVEANGLLNFTNTNFSANYISQDAAKVTTTQIHIAPYGNAGIPAGETILDNQYWVVNRYERSGALNMTTTFSINEDITATDEAQPLQMLLYHRPSNSDGDWAFLANGASANASTDEVTFSKVETTGQFLITRSSAPVISLSSLSDEFCTTAIGSTFENILTYSVEGVNLSDVISITPPVGFEISLSPTSGFSPTPIELSPSTNAVAPTSIYLQFTPNTLGDFNGMITHTTTGGTTREVALSGSAVAPASDFSDMAMQFNGNGDYVSLPDLIWQPTAFTIEFWLKPYSLNNYNQQIGVGWGEFLFHAASNGSFYAGTATGSSRVQSPASTLQLNEWSHCAITFDNGLLNVYHNGHLLGTQTNASLPAAWNGEFNIGSGDGNTIDGELDEFRIWEVAQTQQQIQENMHLTMEVEQGCTEGLIVYHQFNNLNTNSLSDVFGYAMGTTNGDVALVTSSIPVGEGFANMQTEINGLVDFTMTDCSVDFNTQNGASVVFTKINNAPYDVSSLLGGDIALDAQYWVAHRYGTGTFEGDFSFTLSENLEAADEANPEALSLYGRKATSDGNWTWIAAANTVNAAMNQVNFNGLTEFQQFLVSRGTPTFRVQADAQALDICKPQNINLSFSLEAIYGYDGNKTISISTTNSIPNTNFQLSTSSTNLLTPQTVLLEISNTQAAADGAYEVEVTFTDGTITQTKTIIINLVEGNTSHIAGTAMSFDGNGDYVDLGNQPLLDFGGTKHFSIEAWVKPNSANASGYVIGKYNRYIAGQYFFGLNNGQVVFQREVSPYTLTGVASLEADKWYHIAGTYDGNEMKIYIDGELDNSQVSTGGASNNSVGILIGSSYFNGSPGYFIDAKIDELRVWNRARTKQEIRENRHLVVDDCQADLIAYFQFNEAGGDAIDGKNNLTGSLNGDVTRTTASESCGSGYSNTQVEATGPMEFYFTDAQVNYSTQDQAEVVATKINNAPYGTTGIDAADVIFDNQYWVINRYDRNGALNMNMTFSVKEDIAVAEENTPYYFNLYHRLSNDFGDWNLLAYASSANAPSDQLTFSDIPTYGQYVITKNTTPSISLTENIQDFGLLLVGTSSIVQSYTLSAKGIVDPVEILAPLGFEISTDPTSGFTSNLSFAPSNNLLGNTTIYVRFNPSAEQDYLSEITHSSTGVTTNLLTVSGMGRELARTAGNALSCGAGDYLSLPQNDELNFGETEDFTVEFWIYTTASNSDPAIISNKNWNSGGNVGWGLFYRGNDWKVNINGSGGSRVDANSNAPNINDGRWHHLAAVFDRDGMLSLYQDGFMTNQVSIAGLNNLSIDAGYPINVLQDGTGSYGIGLEAKVDELRIWNTARTTQEIREHMHLTLESPESGLVAYYQFKEANGDALDLIGQHHGSFRNSSTRTVSDVPAAAGIAITQNVQNAQTYSFDDGLNDANLDITFSGTLPLGEVVVSYLTGEGPHGTAPTTGTTDNYWIVNNFGSNNTGLNAEMVFQLPTNWVADTSPNAYEIHERNSNAPAPESWISLGSPSLVDANNDVLSFAGVTGFSQFIPSRASVSISPKVFLQGNYNGGLMDNALRTNNSIPLLEPYSALNFTSTGGEQTTDDVLSVATNDAVVDWIFIELRDKNDPTAVLHSRSALLQRDGDIVDIDGISPVQFGGAAADEYYLAIRHRNHLPIRTANPITLSNTSTSIDFTSTSTATFGTNPQADLGNGILGLWAGDATSDNSINAADRSATWNNRNQSGYLTSDVNLDGSCNAADRSITWNNRNKGGGL